MFSRDAWTSDQETWQEAQSDEQTIDNAVLKGIELRPFLRFAGIFVVGVAFFVLPVPRNGSVTVPFDIVATMIEEGFGRYVLMGAWFMVLVSAVLTTVSKVHQRNVVQVSDEFADMLHLEI